MSISAPTVHPDHLVPIYQLTSTGKSAEEDFRWFVAREAAFEKYSLLRVEIDYDTGMKLYCANSSFRGYPDVTVIRFLHARCGEANDAAYNVLCILLWLDNASLARIGEMEQRITHDKRVVFEF